MSFKKVSAAVVNKKANPIVFWCSNLRKTTICTGSPQLWITVEPLKSPEKKLASPMLTASWHHQFPVTGRKRCNSQNFKYSPIPALRWESGLSVLWTWMNYLKSRMIQLYYVMGNRIFRVCKVYPSISQDNSWLQMRVLRVYFAPFSSFGIAEDTEGRKLIVLNKSPTDPATENIEIQIHVKDKQPPEGLKHFIFEILVERCNPCNR